MSEELLQELININERHNSAQKEIYDYGQKQMLQKVMVLVRQWQRGLYSNSEFSKVLEDYHKEFYAEERNI